MNERIRAREIRVIDDDGGQLGIMTPRDALIIARERGIDLIEVAPQAQPPVCKIMDYGKYKYEQAKKEKESAKKHKQSELKDIRLDPRYGHAVGARPANQSQPRAQVPGRRRQGQGDVPLHRRPDPAPGSRAWPA